MRTIEEVVKEIEERLHQPFAITDSDKGFKAALHFVLAFIKTDLPCSHLFSDMLAKEMPGVVKFCAKCGERLDYVDNGKL